MPVTRPITHLIARLVVLAVVPLALCLPAAAQVPVTANADHDLLLASSDAKLAANKRLVYDFYREVFEGGRMELAAKYLAEDYIQHNPNVPTGRQGFVDAFSRIAKRADTIEPRMKAPVVSIVAEGDMVVISFVREYPDPKDSTQKYTTTWFDAFRIQGGKIVEHWDSALKRP